MNIKSAVLTLSLTGLAVFAIAAKLVQSPHLYFGDFKLDHVTDLYTNYAAGKFSAKGNPRLLFNLKSNTSVDAAQIDGVFDPKLHLLKQSVLNGSVVMTTTSGQQLPVRTTVLESEVVNFKSGDDSAVLNFVTPQSVKINSKVPALKEILTLNGSSGDFEFQKRKGQTELVSANLEKPVTFSYQSLSLNSKGEPELDSKGGQVINRFHGHCDHLNISRKGDNYILNFKGGVEIIGESTGALDGDAAFSSFYIQLDAKGQIVEAGSDQSGVVTTDPSTYASHKPAPKGRPGH